MTIARYVGALVAVAIGVVLALLLDPVVDATVLLLMAVLAVAWFGGLGPALLASIVATLSLDYFFTEPLYTLTLKVSHLSHLAMFAVIAAVAATASAGRRNAERSLRQARDELDAKVKERTADLTRTHGEAVAAQQRFRDLVNAVEGIVWEADAHTLQFTFVSEQAERVLGYPVQQWLIEPSFWKDHIHQDDRAATVQGYIAMSRQQRRKHDFEYRMIAASGEPVWLRDLVSVLKDGTHVIALRGVMVDITAQKQAEEAVHLLQTTTLAISAAPDLHTALNIALQQVCAATGWVVGQAWLPDGAGSALYCNAAWWSGMDALSRSDGRARHTHLRKAWACRAGSGNHSRRRGYRT